MLERLCKNSLSRSKNIAKAFPSRSLGRSIFEFSHNFWSIATRVIDRIIELDNVPENQGERLKSEYQFYNKTNKLQQIK